MPRILKVSFIGLAVCSASAVAFAQSRDPTAADALFRQARDAMKQGDYATACPKFAESQRLDPAAGTVLNLAQCEEKQGKFASAMTHFREAADRLPPGDPRIKMAKDGLAAVEKRAPRLTVRLPEDTPPGTKVLRDDVELGAASIGASLPVDPGEHVIITRAPGRKEHKEVVSLSEAEIKEITAAVGEPSEPAEAGPEAKATSTNEPHVHTSDAPKDSPGSTQRTIGYVMTGVGIIAVGVGGYFTLRGKSLDSDATATEHFHPDANYSSGFYCDKECYDKTQDSRSSYKTAYGAFIGGGILIAGGLAMILAAPTAKKEAGKSNVSLNAIMTPGAVGVRLGGAW